MRHGQGFPGGQAEIVFNDVFVEYLEELRLEQRESVLVSIVALCDNPIGSHPLSNRSSHDTLAGWNTLTVLHNEHRVIFSSIVANGVGVIEILCAGPRRAGAAYDMANALIRTGRLTNEEVTEIWQALMLLDVIAEEVGLDGWDFAPPPAPDGMVRAVVASGLLPESIARALSKDELEAAMEHGWDRGDPNPASALDAAIRRARLGVSEVDVTHILEQRAAERCDVLLPRAGVRCIRRAGHPGPHRSRP
jgi:hypothetical protein